MEKKEKDNGSQQDNQAQDMQKHKIKRKVLIRLIGTSHIASQSINDVKHNIEQLKPDVVAVELDAGRLQALMQKDKTRTPFWAIFRIGILGYLFAKLGSWGSRKMGELVGVEPGDEMLTAIREAHSRKITIALIDQPIEITLSRFSSEITFREKARFVKDMLKGIFFRKKMSDELGINLETLDLKKVPSTKIVKKLIGLVRTNYPNAYKVLIEERNKVMAKNILELGKHHDRIIVVVGAGHLEGLKEEMDRLAKSKTP